MSLLNGARVIQLSANYRASYRIIKSRAYLQKTLSHVRISSLAAYLSTHQLRLQNLNRSLTSACLRVVETELCFYANNKYVCAIFLHC